MYVNFFRAQENGDDKADFLGRNKWGRKPDSPIRNKWGGKAD